MPPTGIMARLTYGKLSEAWSGEASDFTPLLAEQLDLIGEVIGVDLAAAGQYEVPSAGSRRIDIVASGADGSEFVIENQYGRGDHDHLTRGLAYAVARHARGLVVIAEEHRDEFRAVAQYLNNVAEYDREHGIAVWLVEAKAVRIGDSAWAPLFTAVVEPNTFTATVEQDKQDGGVGKEQAFWDAFTDEHADTRAVVKQVLDVWLAAGYRRRFEPTHLVLEAPGPASGGIRTVVVLYPDGRVMVPFSAYSGINSSNPIPALTTGEFRVDADELFGFTPGQKLARNAPGWLTSSRAEPLLMFATRVAQEYAAALDKTTSHEADFPRSTTTTPPQR
jgi:hypothetical protein